MNELNNDFTEALYLLKDVQQYLIKRRDDDIDLYFKIQRLMNKYPV